MSKIIKVLSGLRSEVQRDSEQMPVPNSERQQEQGSRGKLAILKAALAYRYKVGLTEEYIFGQTGVY